MEARVEPGSTEAGTTLRRPHPRRLACACRTTTGPFRTPTPATASAARLFAALSRWINSQSGLRNVGIQRVQKTRSSQIGRRLSGWQLRSSLKPLPCTLAAHSDRDGGLEQKSRRENGAAKRGQAVSPRNMTARAIITPVFETGTQQRHTFAVVVPSRCSERTFPDPVTKGSASTTFKASACCQMRLASAPP